MSQPVVIKQLLKMSEDKKSVSLTPLGWEKVQQIEALLDAGYTEEMAAGESGLGEVRYLQFLMTTHKLTLIAMER